MKENVVKLPVANTVVALSLVVLGVALAAAGIYIGETDDAPGAAVFGFLLMIVALILGVRIFLRKA